jgi:hypothetical protein
VKASDPPISGALEWCSFDVVPWIAQFRRYKVMLAGEDACRGWGETATLPDHSGSRMGYSITTL